MKFKDFLTANNACSGGANWGKDIGSFGEAWEKCQRSDWMLWGLARIGYKDERKLRLYGCACIRGTPISKGRTVWALLTDERSRKSVEVAEAYAYGKATEEERAAARDAAWAARDAAWDAARDAAWDAAWAAGDAAWAAARAAGWDAAWAAARAAGWAAALAAARDAAWAARAAARYVAWAAAGAWQANLLRERVSWAEVEKAIRNRNRKVKP